MSGQQSLYKPDQLFQKKIVSIAPMTKKIPISQTKMPILVVLYYSIYFRCFLDIYISETKLNFLLIRNNLQAYLAAFTPCKCFLVVEGSWGSPAPVILCQHQPFHTGRSPEKIMGSVKSTHLKSPFLWCASGVQRGFDFVAPPVSVSFLILPSRIDLFVFLLVL